MPASATILLYGVDPSLLATRHLILERSGFVVRSTDDVGHATKLIEQRAADLIVVCHTVAAAEAEDLLALAQTVRPVMKTVVLIAANPSWIPGTADGLLVALDGPSALLATVKVALEAAEARRGSAASR